MRAWSTMDGFLGRGGRYEKGATLLADSPRLVKLERMSARVMLALAIAFAAAVAPRLVVEEAPLDPATVRSLREKLASGSVRTASAALAEMKAAPHSRHGLLLLEARVRAALRVEDAERRLPEVDAERDRCQEELKAAKRSTSTSAVRRLEEKIAALDDDRVDLQTQSQIESRLGQVCAEAWTQIAPRLAPESAEALADSFLQKLREERQPVGRRMLVEMLGAVPDGRVMPALMTMASERDEAPEVVIAAVEALAARGEASATPAALAAMNHPDWRVQSEAVEALRRMHRRSSIPFVIERLATAEGRLKDDLARALRSLTGKEFVANAAIWRRWWEENQATFEMPPAPVAPEPRTDADAEGAAKEGGTRFFGIASHSKRVVFVLDVSGSMNEPAGRGTDASQHRTKLELAKAHLTSAIAGLASDARFDVLLYAGEVERCFPSLVTADDEHRSEALRFVAERPTAGGTNIHEALLDAFRLAEPPTPGKGAARGGGSSTTGTTATKRPPEVDTIYFLTDGKPTAGRVLAPELILAEILGMNRTRRIRIHTVGVGDHDREFLKALAEQTGGEYVSR
jgi:hypothetical protein